MALKSQARIAFTHSFAVVDDLNGGATGIFNEDFDLGGSGVDGVFHQFFNYRSGTLYDLSGSNLIGYRIG